MAAISRCCSACVAALASLLEEVIVAAALVLITVALWPRFGRLALIVPGIVLLWLALPPRSPFVSPPPASPDKAARKKE